MTQWTFIVGFNDATLDPKTKAVIKTAEENYQGLQDYIKTYYTSRLPKGTPFVTARWNEDVFAKIMGTYATGDIGIIAHSFGGQKAVEVCAALNPRVVKKLILIDPVDYNHPAIPNTTGFAIPRNVLNARCFYRQKPSAMPWSGSISSPVIVNTMYVPTTSDPHGEYVWNASTINEVKAS